MLSNNFVICPENALCLQFCLFLVIVVRKKMLLQFKTMEQHFFLISFGPSSMFLLTRLCNSSAFFLTMFVEKPQFPDQFWTGQHIFSDKFGFESSGAFFLTTIMTNRQNQRKIGISRAYDTIFGGKIICSNDSLVKIPHIYQNSLG